MPKEHTTNEYEVWATKVGGGGGCFCAGFITLELALEYVEKYKGDTSFAILLPSGDWYKWPEEV